jgi:signal transduction histidine kinase
VSSEPQRFPPSDVAVIEDLVRRFQVAIDRVQLFREAQDANRLKEEFLATLSHELRTPVNAILGWARILRTRPLEGGILQAVEVIERNAKAQTRLIEDMLDVSRIVTGKLTFNLETIDLATVIGAALDSVRPAAQAKNIRLVEQVDPMTSPIQGDAPVFNR